MIKLLSREASASTQWRQYVLSDRTMDTRPSVLVREDRSNFLRFEVLPTVLPHPSKRLLSLNPTVSDLYVTLVRLIAFSLCSVSVCSRTLPADPRSRLC